MEKKTQEKNELVKTYVKTKRNNTIEVIHKGDNTLLEQEAIKDHNVNYYENLFKEDFPWRTKLDGLFIDSIDPSSAVWLETIFKEEVLDVFVRGLARDKAPGPDGFSRAFFQAFWSFVREDFMKVFLELHLL